MWQPSKYATVLFDGKDLSGWAARQGGEAKWKIKDGYMEVVPGTGDIHTKEGFGDCHLHVEFWLPLMADKQGQARANSGVYLQGRYEVQVLDSYGLDSQDNDCGGIYKIAKPLVNACRKPEEWQSYDIAFRTARVENKQLKEKPRITVFHNGVMIHNNLEIPMPTGGAMDVDMRKAGPLLLQDHGNLVRYRNVWIMPVK
ncbi:MAG: DUF1080 domain-containing protein [Acidobacteria bacterium]|nr:DUF1080 domain-containing protein [Acidobacteriota bacterium]